VLSPPLPQGVRDRGVEMYPLNALKGRALSVFSGARENQRGTPPGGVPYRGERALSRV